MASDGRRVLGDQLTDERLTADSPRWSDEDPATRPMSLSALSHESVFETAVDGEKVVEADQVEQAIGRCAGGHDEPDPRRRFGPVCVVESERDAAIDEARRGQVDDDRLVDARVGEPFADESCGGDVVL